MSQARRNPTTLLFTDKVGRKGQFQDIVDDGLDGGYEDRIPELTGLLEIGAPYHKLLACAMLTAWGQATGFQTIITWAKNPGNLPWNGAPVVYKRVSNSDSAFETLAQAIKTSYDIEKVSVSDLRIHSICALLCIYHLYHFDRALALAIMRDSAQVPQLAPAIRAAIDASLARLRNHEVPRFNLAFQTSSLLMPLARLNDSDAADYAGQLTAIAPTNEKMLRELANGLAEGSGSATAAALKRLKARTGDTLEPDLTAALERRSHP